jgi:hypothetical protein
MLQYHFDDEIENSLKEIFDDLPNLLEKHDFDLYTVSNFSQFSKDVCGL